jgi:hypothetical protein
MNLKQRRTIDRSRAVPVDVELQVQAGDSGVTNVANTLHLGVTDRKREENFLPGDAAAKLCAHLG